MTPKVLISAYSAEPDRGSESGAGYSIVRAAAEIAEVWVITRANNVALLQDALEAQPPGHSVHIVPTEVSKRALRLKRRYNAVRPYYALWQRVVSKAAVRLDSEVGGFTLAHHATMSAFWMPVGVARLPRPLVIGPISGGTFTPRPLLGTLGPRGLLMDSMRFANAHVAAAMNREVWQRAEVVMVQNREMEAFARTRLGVKGQMIVQSHATNPPIGALPPRPEVRSPLVLFIGRLVTWKGILLALDAFERVGDDSARMVFVGDGADRGLLEREVHRRNLGHKVEIAGQLPRERVLELMLGASCLLFPSFHDSAGFVVSEALALGLPVVCLDHGGPGELTRAWSRTPSVSVRPKGADTTAAELASSVQRFISEPAPIPDEIVTADVDLATTIARAYEIAIRQGPLVS